MTTPDDETDLYTWTQAQAAAASYIGGQRCEVWYTGGSLLS
jgi:hypothetical protein